MLASFFDEPGVEQSPITKTSGKERTPKMNEHDFEAWMDTVDQCAAGLDLPISMNSASYSKKVRHLKPHGKR